MLRRVTAWWWPRFGLPEPGGVTTFHPPPPRPAADPWRDADGTHICLHSRVEQITVDKNHGALRERLHHRGHVIGRGTHLIYVRFDHGNQLVALRPHQMRVLAPGETN